MDSTKDSVTLEELAIILSGFDGFDRSSMEKLRRMAFYSPSMKAETEEVMNIPKQKEPKQFYGPNSLYCKGIEVRVRWSLYGDIYVPTIGILGAHSYQKEEFAEGIVMVTVAQRIARRYGVLFTEDIIETSEHLHKYRYYNPRTLKPENLAESIKTIVSNVKSAQEKLDELQKNRSRYTLPLS